MTEKKYHKERKKSKILLKDILKNGYAGAGGRSRTDMGLPPPDFESGASTSFTTPAK